MKYVLLLCVLILSCTSNRDAKKSSEDSKIDSTLANEDKPDITPDIVDSAVIIDPLKEMTIYRSLKFGDSQNTMNKKIKADQGFKFLYSQYRERSNDFLDYNTQIGNNTYYFSPRFNDNKLYMVVFVFDGYWVNADYYESTLRDGWRDMYKIISDQYGASPGTFPSIHEVSRGVNWTNEWHYGKKTIGLGIKYGKEYSYSVYLAISFQPTVDSLNEVEVKRQIEATEKSKKDF